MGLVKSERQIREISRLASLISRILEESIDRIRPGMTTRRLDAEIEQLLARHGVEGPSKGYHGFPAVSCISVNDTVTHGIPDDTVIGLGDIVDVDLVIERGGYFADVSKTVGVGVVDAASSRLMAVAEECLCDGIAVVRPGATLGDIGYAIQSRAESSGFSVVREFCGHFIGTAMHEGPSVLNYGMPGEEMELEPGMILCIEPMINAGRRGVVSEGFGWNARTRDHSLSSRCEHMVLVTETGHRVLTKHPAPGVMVVPATAP
ncbi:MAG: type I methionyl aminopeptidase [Spirochaetae bacterium HGW-Spirochaetae-3]|jgi:methionyl aminopeptidase|nr:MAG: type I methionyl aminopeptidase [Spirochaetae bacterium HGW-Spirochaetae-3]